ncbi:sigma-E factor regulatory protein RseB domain-containing protein [Frigoribacterium sp. CG_9.8]|uniref:LolA family protein n=1 Tax=Frigoribacterium sp. CG_9.8 TaxID=2787733 RepID=UPI0018CB1EED|nr:sigma-E factor regulatory protein RseB domain-containing protein [Frigoribacterium sp. CG_9.8]MBG6107905.1 outer membrane lipoprotein-sorting protein [Frigoribacterium sp. CG_9.8]
MKRTWLKWMPALAVPVLIASVAVAVPVAANAAVNLPTKTPSQVLALAAGEKVTALSGTLSQTSNFGLPEIPTTGADASAGSAIELLTGSHTARIFVDGSTKQRVQVLDTMAERDMVRNGSEVWLYDSKKKTAAHSTLAAGATSPPLTEGSIPTPDEFASKFLSSVDSTTVVSLGDDLRVAGRTAYNLVLTPKAGETLIGSVSIAVDSETGLPLSVEVFARSQEAPAFRVGFSTLDLGTPDASLFTFTPPAGVTVMTKTPKAQAPQTETPRNDTAKPTVSGTGWDAIVALPAGKNTARATSSPLFAQLTTSVTGGRLLRTSLINVLLTDDGRVFAGSVPLAKLQTAAAAAAATK